MLVSLILAFNFLADALIFQTTPVKYPNNPLLGGKFGFTQPNFTGAPGTMTREEFITKFGASMSTPGSYLSQIPFGADLRVMNPGGVYMKHINLRTLYGEDLSHPDDDYVHANHPEWLIYDSSGNPVSIFVAGEECIDFDNDAYLDWVLNTWMPSDYLDSTDSDANKLTFYLHDNGNFKAMSITCAGGDAVCTQYTSDAGVQAAWIHMLDRWNSKWPNKKLIISGGPNTFESPATQLVYQKAVLAHAAGLYIEGLTDRHSYFAGGASTSAAKRNYLETIMGLADWLADNGKYFIPNMSPENGVTISQDDTNYNYAFFNLLRRGDLQFYGQTTKDASDLWQPAIYPEMNLRLGAPLEDRTTIATNVYRRKFQYATSYVNLSDSSTNVTLTEPINKNSLGANLSSPLAIASFGGITVYHESTTPAGNVWTVVGRQASAGIGGSTAAIPAGAVGDILAIWVKWNGSGSVLTGISAGISGAGTLRGTQVSHGSLDLYGRWATLTTTVTSGESLSLTFSGSPSFIDVYVWRLSVSGTVTYTNVVNGTGTGTSASSGTITSATQNGITLAGLGIYGAPSVSSLLIAGNAADSSATLDVGRVWDYKNSAEISGAATATLGTSFGWTLSAFSLTAQ